MSELSVSLLPTWPEAALSLADHTDDDGPCIQEIIRQVRSQVGNRLRQFSLTTTKAGRWVLRGSVPSYHVKQLVQHRLMQLSDRPIHENLIEVWQ